MKNLPPQEPPRVSLDDVIPPNMSHVRSSDSTQAWELDLTAASMDRSCELARSVSFSVPH